jgi:hypothetical protein
MKFLHRFDAYLLLHRLHIWRTRAHYVLFFSLLAFVSLFLIGYFYPLDMLMVAKNYQDIENIKQLSFMFSVVLATFGIIAWWRVMSKHPILSTTWREAIVENALYFVCLFVIWQATNAFSTGLNANIVGLKNRIRSEERARLEEELFFVPITMNRTVDDSLYISKDMYDKELTEDSLQKHLQHNISLMKQFVHRAKTTTFADSQYVINPYFDYSEYYSSLTNLPMNYYYSFYDSEFNNKEERRLKTVRAFYRTQTKIPYDNAKLSSNSEYMWKMAKKLTKKDLPRFKKIEDSLTSIFVNSAISKEQNKEHFSLIGALDHIDYPYAKAFIDTCDASYFKFSHPNYMKTAQILHFYYERDILKKRFEKSLSETERKEYHNYLSRILQLFPSRYYYTDISSRSLVEKEILFAKLKDEIYFDFYSKIDAFSQKTYSDLMKFHFKQKQIDEEIVKPFKMDLWNTRNGKYTENKYFPTTSGIDSIIACILPMASKTTKWKQDTFLIYERLSDNINEILPFTPKIAADREYYAKYDSIKNHYVYYYYEYTKGKEKGERDILDKEYFKFIKENKSKKNHIDIYGYYRNLSRGKIDSFFITPDSMLRKRVRIHFEHFLSTGTPYSYNYNRSYGYDNIPLPSLFRKNLSDPDSMLLRAVMQRNGFMNDASYTFDRDYLLSSAYYLQVADIQINRIQKTFFDTYDFLGMSRKTAFCLCLMAILLFLLTSVESNVFIAIFASFFIVFFNFSIFKIVNALTQSDANMPLYLSFAVLGVLAAICSIYILFIKRKVLLINTLFLIQVFSLLGILIWIFNHDDIHRHFNYLASYIGLLFFLTLIYRKYLALPAKK